MRDTASRVRPSLGPPVEGIFPLELTWVLNPFPKTLSDESINRVHSIEWTQKILTFLSWTGQCWQQKHTQHVPSTKMECDYLYGWIKKKNGHICTNLTQKMVNSRDIAGNTEEEEENCSYRIKGPVQPGVPCLRV